MAQYSKLEGFKLQMHTGVIYSWHYTQAGTHMALQKLPPFVYQFYPYPNYPRIPGVQVDLFWNGSESEGYNV